MRILITGALGWTAHAILHDLHQQHTLIGIDLPDASRSLDSFTMLADYQTGDVANENDVKNAIQGCQAVVHLAVAVGIEDYENPNIPFKTNVRGTYNIFEQACLNNVQKVILMSSAPVHLPAKRLVRATDTLRTASGGDHLYDLTKRLQEDIARNYAETFGMDVITLRAGHIVDGRTQQTSRGQNLREVSYCRGGWVCRYDLAQAVARALTYEQAGYDAFHIIGDTRAHQLFDVQRTIDDLGVEFSVDFSDYEPAADQISFLQSKRTD